MGWSFENLYKSTEDGISSLFSAFRDDSGAGSLSTLVQPVDPYNRSSILTPVVTAAALCGVVIASVVAVTSFSLTMAALLAVYFLLTEVFGYELEVMPFPGQAPS